MAVLRKIVLIPVVLIAATLLIGQQTEQEEQRASPSSRAPADLAQRGDSAAEKETHPLPPTNDPKEIVRRSVEADHRSWSWPGAIPAGNMKSRKSWANTAKSNPPRSRPTT